MVQKPQFVDSEEDGEMIPFITKLVIIFSSDVLVMLVAGYNLHIYFMTDTVMQHRHR